MDNKFVHIDRVFKEGLSGGEEQEREGAWLRMKELLDREMPVGGGAPPVRRPFRRYWMPALLLLLVTSAGGGSYYFLNRDSAEKQESLAVAGRSGTGHPEAKETKDHTPVGNQPASGSATSEGGSSYTGSNRPVAEGNRSGAVGGRIPGSRSGGYKEQDNDKNRNKDIAGGISGNKAIHDNKMTSHPTAVIAGRGKSETAMTRGEHGPRANALRTGSLAGTPDGKEAEPFSRQQIEATQKELKVMADNGSLVALQDGPIVKKSEQEITRMAVTERPVYESIGRNSRKLVGFIRDTTSLSRKKEVIYQELTPLEVAAISKMAVKIDMDNIAPMASSVRYANGERGVRLVALSEYKVKSKKTTPEKINEIIGSTRNGIASLFDGTRRYYAALMLGGNASLGNPSAFGLQLGIAGFYALSERWTLGAELKYYNRSFSNYKLADEFVTYRYGTPTMSGSEFIYSYEERFEGKYYKIQNFGTLELPITLTYNLGRVSIFGGANMAYGFALHPLVATEANSASKTLATSTAQFPLTSQSAKVVPTDFKSRFGLGYVFGMTYDLSRNFSLDARMSQNVWDNAAGEMSRQLSNALFRKPSLQFGLNIYFGRREKVTYILER